MSPPLLQIKFGFNLVMHRVQHGHSDLSAAMQPPMQQAVMVCVF